MTELGEGLTKVYNRFHDPSETDECVTKWRELRRRMDEVVAAAYDWNDLIPDHDFRRVDFLPSGDNIRFTIGKIPYEYPAPVGFLESLAMTATTAFP